MAQAVVDQLEAVEVDEAQGEAPARSLRARLRAGGGRSARGWAARSAHRGGQVGELGLGRLARP
jgi:hypothetical protein